jgi:transposase, IS5 family
MFKILLLQQWHTLSDPAAEEAVRDRLSFRRFCGLPLDMETPDHASIWRFRQTIDKLGLSVALLTEVNRQLDARGFVIKRGTLVDATIIAGAVRRPYEGGGVNPRDPEARFTRKRDKTYFGYKAHLAVDEESGLVRQAEMTSANVHDSRLGEALIQGDEQGYFADRAYDSQALRETLERRGVVDGIAWKVKHARYPLEAWQRLHNAWTGSVRSAVERAFATMKRWYGMGRVRYLGLARNACHLQFVAMAMNMKRALVLMRVPDPAAGKTPPSPERKGSPAKTAKRSPPILQNPLSQPQPIDSSNSPSSAKLSDVVVRYIAMGVSEHSLHGPEQHGCDWVNVKKRPVVARCQHTAVCGQRQGILSERGFAHPRLKRDLIQGPMGADSRTRYCAGKTPCEA